MDTNYKVFETNWFNAFRFGNALSVVDCFSGELILHWNRNGERYIAKHYFKNLFTITGIRNKLFEMGCVKEEKRLGLDAELPF